MNLRRSSPPVCPTCNGARRVVTLAPDFDDLGPLEKLRAGVGFWHNHCLVCFATGTTHPRAHEPGEFPPPPPDYDPGPNTDPFPSLYPDLQGAPC